MPELQRFLISGGQFGNRCKETLKNGPTAAVILDFRPRLGNRCMVLPGNAIFRALILDFRPRLGNRCMVLPENAIFRASILDFKARLGNRCKETLKNSPKTTLILDFRPRIKNHCKDCRRQRRTARLQHSRGVQAGTGCHEGGIILSKQPPEWRLSLPQQRSASDSNYRCCS